MASVLRHKSTHEVLQGRSAKSWSSLWRGRWRTASASLGGVSGEFGQPDTAAEVDGGVLVSSCDEAKRLAQRLA